MTAYEGVDSMEAWARTVTGVAERKGGSIAHANTTFPCEPNAGEAHNRIGEELASKGELSVAQVADTIFTQSLYRSNATGPAASLFENWEYARRPVSSALRMWPYRRSFPCLSHVSLTVLDGEIHLMAQYRYQYLVRKGVGNYLGLSRLLAFFASELDLVAGQVTVNAVYARVDAKGEQ